MIPDFENRLVQPEGEPLPYRVLPVGIHESNEPDMAERFVNDFPASQNRPVIWQGFIRLRRESEEHAVGGHQWVAGSFTTTKENPGDLDVVTFVDYEAVQQFNSDQEVFLRQKLDGRKGTHAIYQTHAFTVIACSQEHPYYPVFKIARDKWLKWSGKTRPLTDNHHDHPRGSVALALGAGLQYAVTGVDEGNAQNS